MTRARLLAAIAIPVVLLVALIFVLLMPSTNSNKAATPGNATSPTTSSLPVTSVSLPTAPSSEDWYEVIKYIFSYRQSLRQDPRPQLLEVIYEKDCPCYQEEQRNLLSLARQNLRFEGKAPEILAVKLLGRDKFNPSHVLIEVEYRDQPQIVRDADGKMIERLPRGSRSKMVYELIKGRGNRWRVHLIVTP